MQEHQPMTELLSQYYDSILKELTDPAVAVSHDFPSSFYNNLSEKSFQKWKYNVKNFEHFKIGSKSLASGKKKTICWLNAIVKTRWGDKEAYLNGGLVDGVDSSRKWALW